MEKQEPQGTCKQCSRFVFPSNLIDTGWGIVCSESCEKDLEISKRIVAFNSQAISTNQMANHIYISMLQKSNKFYLSIIGTWFMFLFIALSEMLSRKEPKYSIAFSIVFVVLIVSSMIRIRINNETIRSLESLDDEIPDK